MVICLRRGALVQICIWPSWCHCHSLSLAAVNPDWFYHNGSAFLEPAYPGCHGKKPLNERSVAASTVVEKPRLWWQIDFEKIYVWAVVSDTHTILTTTSSCVCTAIWIPLSGSLRLHWHRFDVEGQPFFTLFPILLFGRPYYRSSLWYSVSSVCLSSVTFCIVAKQYVLAKKCLKEWIGNQGQKVHFLGCRHISTSGFAATAIETAVFALFLPVQPSNRY